MENNLIVLFCLVDDFSKEFMPVLILQTETRYGTLMVQGKRLQMYIHLQQQELS